MINPKVRPEGSDKISRRRRQPSITESSVGKRILEALGDRDFGWLSRESGVPDSTIGDYVKRGISRADTAVKIARALGTTVEYLLEGGTPATGGASLVTVSEADFVWVPRFDLWSFDADGKPAAIEAIPIRRDWLYGVLRRSGGLWFADMPSDVLPDVAHEGETIVCEDPGPNLQERGIYAFWRDGEVMVRRVSYSSGGYTLSAESVPQIELPRRGQPPPDELLTPIARVLATYAVREV